MTTITSTAAHALNNFLQGELAAIEAYDIAMEKFDGYEKQLLYQIKLEHLDTCSILETYVQNQNGHSEASAGIWGVWSQLVELTARILGQIPALKALKEGEEYGIREYKDSLTDKELPAEVRDIIEAEIIPALEKHVTALEHLMDNQN